MSAPTTPPATTQPPALPAAVLALSPGYTDDAAAGAIRWALTQVESYCERQFASRTNTVTVTAHGGQALLPDPPVTAVAAVKVFARPTPAQALDWLDVDLAGIGWTEDGQLYNAYARAASWPSSSCSLKVTYTHGFTEWPQAVTDSVVALAVAYLANPAGMSERRVLDTTYRWMAGVGAAGIVDPFAGLSRYVLREVS